MPKITKRTVDAMRPETGRDVFTWDTELRGFGVRMKPSGAAAFLIQYRTLQGRTRRHVIGRVGTLTPDQARTEAKARLAEVATKGADPSAERKATREAMTVAELCDEYLVKASAGEWLGRRGRPIKASTLAMDRSRIDRHIKPLLGNHAVASVTAAHIERFQADVAAGKTARPRRGRGGLTTGGRGVASRAVGMLGTILEYGRRRRVITDNPARSVKRHADGRQDRCLSFDELFALGDAIRKAADQGENPTALAAVRFLLLSGFRRMEALALPREAIDERRRCARFADTKSGAQVRPIGRVALDTLATLGNDRGPWVFPAERGDGHFVGLPKVLARLCSRANLEGVTVHTLRHSFASAAAELGFSELTIAGLLGHRVGSVTGRYTHLRVDGALASAADRVAAHIAAALDGVEAKAN